MSIVHLLLLQQGFRGTRKCLHRTASLEAFFNSGPLKPNGHYIHHVLQHTKTMHSALRVYLCVPYGSHNKQRLFP
jgi:hypothetical protein